jgi:integrase/recombinase XerD
MRLETGNIVTDLQRWVDTYTQEITNKNLSKRTLNIYSGVLNEFIEYARGFQGEAGIEDINRIFLNGYLTNRANTSKQFGPSTKKLHITILKTYFAYITENNDNNVDFEKMFKKMKIRAEIKEKPSISEDDIIRLLKYLEKEKNAPRNRIINYRNSLLIKIMLYGGLREHEMMPYRLKDFIHDVENNVYILLVKGKGSKERYIYVPFEMIADEMDTLREEMGEGWYICSTRNNTIINRSNLWTIITGIYKRAGVDQSGIHILRHTFARRLVNNNTNLKTISELLGHSDIAITARFYAKTNETNKRDAVASLMKRP